MLPDLFKLKVLPQDLEGAVCGSPEFCTIAQAIRRSLGVDATTVRVKPNGITITYKEYVHHYHMPDDGMKIVRETDAGIYKLNTRKTLVFQMIGAPRRADRGYRDPARRQQIAEARKKRQAAGHKDSTYINYRLIAARRAGLAYKKLAKVQDQRTASP